LSSRGSSVVFPIRLTRSCGVTTYNFDAPSEAAGVTGVYRTLNNSSSTGGLAVGVNATNRLSFPWLLSKSYSGFRTNFAGGLNLRTNAFYERFLNRSFGVRVVPNVNFSADAKLVK
jgi:hypothetical protein